MRFPPAAAASLLPLLLPGHASAQSVSTVKLRGGPHHDESHYQLTASASSSCNGLPKGSCASSKDESGEDCRWCEAGAVPSACYSKSQADSLPPGVFKCSGPGGEDDGEAEDAPESASFSFLPSATHTLTDGPVDPELCDPSSPKSISGYMSVKGSKYDEEGENKHLFFWFFEKRGREDEDEEDGKDDSVPLIVWLTGGPGCSSTLALLAENGPCSVNRGGKSTKVNPYSWIEAAHVLWLDQPAGVGYSYGKETDSNEQMISEDAYYFLQAFYKKHPEYASNPLYVIGESYGGHYAPAIAHRVFLENKKLPGGRDDGGEGEGSVSGKDKKIKINLAGVAVGNGLTDPGEQYKWYAEMAYNNSHGIKVIDETTYNAMTAAIPKCTALIDKCNEGDTFIDTFACQTAFAFCNMAMTSPYRMTGLNPYDIRKRCGLNPLCYDFSDVETFLNLDSTRRALHVSDDAPRTWNSCNMGINLMFHVDWMKDFSPYVGDMLNGGIPVLIYAGDVDFICNYLGNRAWTLGLKWDHAKEFSAADDHDWDGGKGLARTANGFTYLQVYDAGHMVPSDQPEVALDMIKVFVTGGTF